MKGQWFAGFLLMKVLIQLVGAAINTMSNNGKYPDHVHFCKMERLLAENMHRFYTEILSNYNGPSSVNIDSPTMGRGWINLRWMKF